MNRYIPENDLTEILSRLNEPALTACETLLQTGYRVDDIMHMRGYQCKDGIISLTERKTGKQRKAYVDGKTKEKIEKLKDDRHRFSYVFATLQPRPSRRAKMHRTTLYRHFEKAVNEAGLTGKGYTIHSLRKVYAVRAFQRYGSLEKVRELLGHSSVNITALYALSDVL